MIPERIAALFDFIDFLDTNKAEYINKYLPLCEELSQLDTQRSLLRSKSTYIEKQKYDAIQKEITEKFQPIQEHIFIPFTNKLIALKIWSGDDVYTSIWNNNISAIIDFKENYELGDVETVFAYKHKYLNFRKETNSNFLSLKFVLNNLDEIYKALFDFFKDTSNNEFERFEAKVIEVKSMADAVKGLANGKNENVIYSLPQESLLDYQNLRPYYPELYQKSANIKNEIFMGHKIEIGSVNGHGNIISAGNDVNIHATTKISKGNLDSLKQQMASYGIENEDIEELSEIVQAEDPNSGNNTLGAKSNGWILKIAGKALSGAGKIATGISSNILAAIIREYYGI